MKRNIKRLSYDEWQCSKCGLAFSIYGPGGSYLGPSFCPNCGVQFVNGESKKQKEEKEELDKFCSSCTYYESGICEQDEKEYKEVPRDWCCDKYKRW